MAVKIKTKTLDCYLVGDLFIFLAVIALAKGHLKVFPFPLILTSFFYLLGISIAKGCVYNSSNIPVFAMDENDHDKITFVPNGESVSNIDGINVAGLVYKIPDGVNAIVTSNGVKVVSITGRILFNTAGGRLQQAPDPTWNDLFRIHLA